MPIHWVHGESESVNLYGNKSSLLLHTELDILVGILVYFVHLGITVTCYNGEPIRMNTS